MTGGARTLIWDIETSPGLGFVWGKYDQNVLAFEQEWYLLSIAWKWLGEKKIHVVGLPDFDRYATDPTNDYDLAATAHGLFDAADVVIAHNGIAFDTKKAQARMLIHGFSPPSPFKEVDTLRAARKRFAFTSNRLDDLCKALGIGQKRDTGGFNTWLGCINGDLDAWARMKKYNKHDVRILEQLYLRLRPWIDGHPNIAMLDGNMDSCPKCGADAMSRQGFKFNRTTTVQQWKCRACGGWASSRTSKKVPQPSLVN